MTNPDPLDDRLRAGLRDLADAVRPDEVADPAALADELLHRAVPSPDPAGTGGWWRGGWRRGGWRSIAAVVAVAAVGAGFGAWAGRSDPAPDGAAAAVPLTSAPLWRCPDGAVVGRLTGGDRVLLTGRSDDGVWLELRSPSDLSARVWIAADVVDADAVTDDLPVADCPAEPLTVAVPVDPATPTPSSTTAPTASTTTSTPSVSTTTGPTTTTKPVPTTSTATAPTSTTAAPTSTTPPPADTTGPSITNAGANPATVWTLEQPGVPCPAEQRIWTTVLSATVSDSGGVASARVDWSVNGRSGTVAMNATGSTWRATLGPFAADTLPTSGAGMNQTVGVTVRAVDTAGNVSTASTSFQLRSSAECFG